MKLRASAYGTLLLLLVGVACGRVDDEEPGHGTGGTSEGGGTGGTGGTAPTTGGFGAVASGGSPPTGGTNSGGAPTSGGKSTTGGAVTTGGVAVMGGMSSTGGSSAGAGGVGGVPASYVPIGTSSWDVEMAVTLTGKSSYPFSCNLANFTMHFESKAGALAALSGRNGSVMLGKFVPVAGSRSVHESAEPSVLPSVGDCGVSSIQVSGATIEGIDYDGDGVADELSGEGKGAALQIVGDVGMTVPLTFALSGTPDVRAPSLLLPASVHPLDGVRCFASEPVKTGSKVVLKSGSSTLSLDGSNENDGALGSFYTAAILPFASRWDVSVSGQDLAGLPFQTAGLGPLEVLADPGVFAQDGFEAAPNVLLTGTAAIVSKIGTLPAISGSKSLFVPPGGTATLHLARAAGKNSVRFTAQTLTSVSGAGAGAPPVQAGVYQGVVRVRASAPATNELSVPTGDAMWGFAGAKQAYTLALSESGGDVVLLVAPQGCQGLCPLPQAVWIDDVRVE